MCKTCQEETSQSGLVLSRIIMQKEVVAHQATRLQQSIDANISANGMYYVAVENTKLSWI